MNIQLFSTTAFRLTIIYAALFSLFSAVTLGFIYWSLREEIESQVDARLRLETDFLVNLYKSGALTELLDAIQQRNQVDTYGRFYYLESEGSEITEGAEQEWPLRIKSVRTHSTKPMGEVVDLPNDSPRSVLPVRVAQTQFSNGLKLTIGHEISDEKALLDYTFALVVGATIITLIFAVLGGIWMSLSVLKRIASVNKTAGEIMSGAFSRRIPVTERRDEFDAIAVKINQMLTRIEDLMISMQQVTNNVAHDLRSPLTRLRNRLEVTLLEDRTDDEYRATIESSIGEADGMIHTFNAMLSIARLEAGLDKTEWQDVYMGELAAELAELYSAVSEDAEISFEERIHSNPIFHGNRHLLAQAITNLLDNAIKYTRVRGIVGLYVSGNDEAFSVTVTDNGPGIPRHERERVLQRFVRLENERKSPGNGLGLSLVQAVARMHRAELHLQNNHPGLAVTLAFRRRAIDDEVA
ncbi:hypothetical protein AB833_17025 [Chromatiales bacterium (ex Bugula neritina AB1)]|nr:hypothetical protein AB833_17025 [Chromatiales bacterium (ex Bugula neritina AB1)]